MANPFDGVETTWWLDWGIEKFSNRDYLSLSLTVEIIEVLIEKPGKIWASLDALDLSFETNVTKVVHHLVKGAQSTVPMTLSRHRDEYGGYILRPPNEHPCLLPMHHICLSSLPNGTLTCSLRLSITSCSIDFINKAVIPQNIKCTPVSTKLGSMLTCSEEDSKGKYSDITLIAAATTAENGEGGTSGSSCMQSAAPVKFYAHKAILAAHSPVFARMFEHDMKEGSTNEVTILDIEPAILKEMLTFMYTNKAMNVKEMGHQLVYAADKYQIDELMAQCEYTLGYSLSVENCINMLLLAHTHGALNLKVSAMQFIAGHGEEVMQLEEWNKLNEHAELLSELIKTIFKTASEPAAKRQRFT